MPITNSGLRVLGEPVGTIAFYRSFATENFLEILKDLDTLGRMPSHQAQLLVATKAVVRRINHLYCAKFLEANSQFSAKWRQPTTVQLFQLLVA